MLAALVALYVLFVGVAFAGGFGDCASPHASEAACRLHQD
jgi:hypothetical protein